MLKVKNLTFEVNEEGKKRCLVNHISFDVQDGEILVITGPNGGGKSTLAKVLAGIEKADSGEIYLDDENITEYDIDHRANAGIGYAFQQPPRFKGMTVKKMLSQPGQYASNERVTEIMFVFGQAPAGFAQVETPYLNCTAVANLPANSSFVNIADVGGVYNGQWIMATSRWVTRVYKPSEPLPRTGY